MELINWSEDVNNYVQVTVSQKKYKNGSLGDTVYISVVGTKNIKKSTDEMQCLYYASSGSPVQALSTLLKSPDSSFVRSHPSHNESISQNIEKSIPRNYNDVNFKVSNSVEYIYL